MPLKITDPTAPWFLPIYVYLGDDADTVTYGFGNHRIFAGGGGDTIHAGWGDDIIYGEGGADRLYGDEGNDWIYGNPPTNVPLTNNVLTFDVNGNLTSPPTMAIAAGAVPQMSAMSVNLGGTATNFSTAGGFSNYFPQPEYQKATVEKYFKKADLKYPYYSEFEVDVNTTKGIYNRIGRAYPDVAANGANFRAYLNGVDEHWYGSSLASPLFASVLTLVRRKSLDSFSRNVSNRYLRSMKSAS